MPIVITYAKIFYSLFNLMIHLRRPGVQEKSRMHISDAIKLKESGNGSSEAMKVIKACLELSLDDVL